MDILRFITAGSVDDGKSTLIGRLLYDSKSILIDQLEAIEKQSKNKEDGEIDLAFASAHLIDANDMHRRPRSMAQAMRHCPFHDGRYTLPVQSVMAGRSLPT